MIGVKQLRDPQTKRFLPRCPNCLKRARRRADLLWVVTRGSLTALAIAGAIAAAGHWR